MKHVPTPVGPSSSWKLFSPRPYEEPESTPERMSIIMARPEPLGPPSGSREPFSARFGSVVGSPFSSQAHPRGMLSPLLAARRIFPRATTLDDMSSRS